jgi:hypothetical protein
VKVTANSETAMTQTRDDAKAAAERAADPAGRGDASKGATSEVVYPNEARFREVMGAALIGMWGDLPQPLQEELFECAVRLGHKGERDEMLREQLAKFLHEHHQRTSGA